MKAQTFKRRTPPDRKIISAPQGNATEAIGDLWPGCEIFIFTHGQFSLINALVAVLEQTGPARVTLSTWTAAHADTKEAAHLIATAQITDFRMVIDRSFQTRQPAYCRQVREVFGDDCIRTTRAHCKWATIRNESWNIALRTSMNLNTNPRLEDLEISDSPAFADFLDAVADQLFEDQQAGIFNGELPPVQQRGVTGIRPISGVGRFKMRS